MSFVAENLPTDELIKSVSRALARAYACGWEQYAVLVGNMKGITPEFPDRWAKANAHMFTQEAVEALTPKE